MRRFVFKILMKMKYFQINKQIQSNNFIRKNMCKNQKISLKFLLTLFTVVIYNKK